MLLLVTMVYIMKFYVEGACRGNGQPGSIGAAACCLAKRNSKNYCYRSYTLAADPMPTNQRAEIVAILIALEWAIEKFNTLNSSPRLAVEIFTDSRYAINCMTSWIYKWSRNGWRTSAGYEITNRDLVEKASVLDDRLRNLGTVEYKWVARSDNVHAAAQCKKVLDWEEKSQRPARCEFDSDSDISQHPTSTSTLRFMSQISECESNSYRAGRRMP
ncbi:ribonuclease H-like domain-containing protein [Xylariaceae sp. FL0594]|nr:ribonuclease H-like domain-containing protein [Xylariaceae sp. FL0594]